MSMRTKWKKKKVSTTKRRFSTIFPCQWEKKWKKWKQIQIQQKEGFQLYFHVNEKTKWKKWKKKKQVQQKEGFQLYFHVNENKMEKKKHKKKKQVQQKEGFQLYFHVNEKNYFRVSLTCLLTLTPLNDTWSTCFKNEVNINRVQFKLFFAIWILRRTQYACHHKSRVQQLINSSSIQAR